MSTPCKSERLLFCFDIFFSIRERSLHGRLHAKNDLLSIYRGAMAEQFVGREMLVSQQGGLYYWDRQAKSSSAEVDYLAVLNGRIHPVEVKSGATGSSRSLHLFLASYPECGRALVFSDRPYAGLPEQQITFLPLYSAFAVTRNE